MASRGRIFPMNPSVISDKYFILPEQNYHDHINTILTAHIQSYNYFTNIDAITIHSNERFSTLPCKSSKSSYANNKQV